MAHHMKLNPEPFFKIQNGTKTIELRLYDEKRQKIKTGDRIVFTNTETAETIEANVKDIFVFDSFDELYSALPLTECGYSESEAKNASPDDMLDYYSKDEQRRYGVCGIKIELFRSE